MLPEPLAIGAVGEVATTSLLWRFGGQLHMCVAVSATFRLVDDGTAVRALRTEESSLEPALDRVPYREGCDVWMVGHCNAEPLNATAPITTRVVLTGSGEQLLEKKQRLMKGSHLGVAGYGPRRTAKWLDEFATDGVVDIPSNFDWTKLHAAPPGQRVRHLEGGERLVIEGVLEGRNNKMRCRMPSVQGEARIWSRGSQKGDPGYPISMVADTLAIDTDHGLAVIVWRGSFPIESGEVPGTLFIAAGVSSAEQALDWDEGWIMAKTTAIAAGASTNAGTLDLNPARTSNEPAVPFAAERPSQQGQALRPARLEGAPWSDRAPAVTNVALPPQRGRAMTVDIEDGFAIDDEPLPFQPGAATSPLTHPVSQTEPAFEISSMETVETPPLPATDEDALPFGASGEWDALDPPDDI